MLRSRLRIAPHYSRAMDLEDVLQVTFMEAFLRVRTLRDRSLPSFRAWLLQMAENNVKDAVRALERDKRPDAQRRITTGPSGESSRTLLGRMAPGGSSHATKLGEQEQIAVMLKAVAQLPASYAQVVRAIDLDECPVAEVAARMNRSKGSIHMLRARAHDRLRELLAPSLGQDQNERPHE